MILTLAPRAGQRGRKTTVVLVAALSLFAASCGSRLTPKQVAALNRSGANSGEEGAAASVGGSDVGASTSGGGVSAGPGSASGSSGGSSGAKTSSGGASQGGAAAASKGAGSTAGVDPAVCKGPASGPGITPTEVDIGMVTTQTGPIPGLEKGSIDSMNAFVGYLNSIGGICGRKVVLKIADDNLDVSQNATATQSLVNSVFAMVGSDSGVDQGGASALKSSGIPDIGEALSHDRFNLPNQFSPQPQPPGVNLAPYLYFKTRVPEAVTKMAVLALNQATALEETKAAIAGMQSIGYKFVYQNLNIEPTQTDFRADAQAMKSAGAQGILFLALGTYYADVAKAMQAVGLKMAFADYSSNAYDDTFLSQAGSAANGSLLYSESALYQGEDAGSIPAIALFDKWYKAVSGGDLPNDFAVWGWMSGLLFLKGLNAGGGLTRTNLMNGLKQVTSFDADGIQSAANPAGKAPPPCYVVIDVTDEKFVRDAANPSGFNCSNAPNFYRYSG